MIIQDIQIRNIRIPLEDPKTFSTKHVSYRDYTIVNIRTKSGLDGWSFVWGLPVVKPMIEMVEHLLIGEPAYATTKLWYKMFGAIDRWSRSGIGMRAIAALDMALWDLMGKAAGMPIHRMLGAYRDQAPAYYSGGYYPASYENKSELLNYVEKELGANYARGFRAFKMKIGAASPAFDIERIAVARKTIGPDSKLMLDANCGYDPETIIPMAAKFEQYDITWLEEPVLVDDLPGCAYVASRVSMPVALGENHFTRWQMREIIDAGAARILQADPTVMGGVTEYLHICGVAATYGIKLAPHCFHDFSIQLALARPEIMTLEYMDADSDVINIQKVIQNPVTAVNGMVGAPDGPGHGLLLDEKALARYLQ